MHVSKYNFVYSLRIRFDTAETCHHYPNIYLIVYYLVLNIYELREIKNLNFTLSRIDTTYSRIYPSTILR